MIYFSTVSATLSQFHGYTLALFFAPLLIYSSLKQSSLIYYLSLGLFLLVQENTSLVAFFFGLYLLLNPKTRQRGYYTFFLALAYFALVIQWVTPSLSPYHSYLFGSIYGNVLGNSIPQIIAGSIKHPLLFLTSIFTPPNLIYLRNLLIGIFPFALLSPTMLLVALSSLAQNLLSSSLGLKTQQMHYESGAVAFLFYAMILGLAYFLRRTKSAKSSHRVWIALVLIIVSTLVSYKKLTSPRFNSLDLYSSLDQEMDDFQALIPQHASVATQDYLSAQLSNRTRLYQYPVYHDRVEYLLLSKGEAVWPLTVAQQQEYLSVLSTDPAYRVVKESDRFILYQLIPNARP